MMKTKFTYVVLAFAALTIVGCGKKNAQQGENLPTVRIDTVKVADSESTLQYPGRVVPAHEVNMSFKVAGTLKKVYVDEGDQVKAGQLIAEIDPVDYQVQLKATEAEYAQIKADAERVIGLYQDGGTTASNYDKARYGLEQIEAKLQNHKNQLAYTKIYAPFSGFVQTKFFNGGETVAAGMPVVSILSGNSLEVEVNLPANSYTHRDSFCQFSCTMDVLPDQTLPLQLINIQQKANSNQLYTMRLRLPDAEHIAAGMSAWVTILSCDSTQQVETRIPTTSLLEANGKTYVFIYNSKDQVVHQTTVDVDRLHTDGSVVVRGNLNVGDLIVSTGVHYLQDGLKVKILEPVSKTNVGGLL